MSKRQGGIISPMLESKSLTLTSPANEITTENGNKIECCLSAGSISLLELLEIELSGKFTYAIS